jgi:hypothetical protein
MSAGEAPSAGRTSRLAPAARAGAVAAVLSGLPSTTHALVRRRSLLESTRAAGTVIGRPTLAGGAAVHVAVSAGWTVVLWRTLPARRPVMVGALAGAAIAALDLGVLARRFPAIAALPTVPQVADHIAFGVLVALGLRPPTGSPSS